MIRINLLKKERRGLTLPDISKLRKIELRDLLKDRALYIVPIVGFAVVGVEVYYAYQLKQEINTLRVEVNNLTLQRNKLKKKADAIQAQKRALQAEINKVKTRIKYLEMSKDVILVLKRYYEPFNGALNYLYTIAPSTVWFDSLSQNMDFEKVNVELNFGSYNIDSIKDFYSTVKREFPFLLPGEIKKQENKSGIIFYVSSVKAKKDLTGGGE